MWRSMLGTFLLRRTVAQATGGRLEVVCKCDVSFCMRQGGSKVLRLSLCAACRTQQNDCRMIRVRSIFRATSTCFGFTS